MKQILIEKNNGYILLFCYPMDNSVRPAWVLNQEAIQSELDKYQNIRYFICAFHTNQAFFTIIEEETNDNKTSS